MEEAAKMQFEPDGAKIEKTSRALGQENQVKDTGRKRRGSVNRRTAPEEMTEETTVRVTDHDRRAVAFAMKHIYERQSAATLNQLQTEAFNGWSCGRATWRGVAQVLAETPLLRGQFKGRELVTTAEVLAEENRLVDGCLDGKWRHEAVNPNWKIHDEKLNEQQREAVKHVLTSRDWVIGIAGKAGTGKTTLLHEVRRGVEAGSKKFLPLAPSSEAARETLRGEGFKNAETVAQLLVSEKLQRESRGAVWIVDEAGLLSSRQADRLFSLAKELDARLVLVGDTGQHHSVERGQAFDLLENFAHLSVTHVEEIMRQKGFLKQVVKRVAEGNVEEAIGMLKESGDIQQMTLEERKIALAADYVGAIERGKTALVVAPTHAECNDVTAGIRELLKEKKMIKQGAQWDVLRNLSWTEAAREDYDHYEKGQVVQFNGHVKGFALGERAEVVGVKDGAVMVRSESGDAGKIKKLPLRESKKFNVYERDKAEICAGELVRIRINSRTADGHRVSNGNLYKVDHIDGKGQLVLENGWKLDKDFAHLDYGYTLTSHAAQSKTVDSVFVAQTAKLSTCASDLNQFYVSISRGRSELKIYTDDIDLLMEIVSQVRERPMATEILHGNAEEEKRLAEIFGVEQAELAAFLGQVDATELKQEMEIELEKIRQRQQEKEMSKTREMEMTMGL
jgi:ATP-dependent exoDNAse (exonuclease V) alpha subunit